jgi:hypothetical protein
MHRYGGNPATCNRHGGSAANDFVASSAIRLDRL